MRRLELIVIFHCKGRLSHSQVIGQRCHLCCSLQWSVALVVTQSHFDSFASYHSWSSLSHTVSACKTISSQISRPVTLYATPEPRSSPPPSSTKSAYSWITRPQYHSIAIVCHSSQHYDPSSIFHFDSCSVLSSCSAIVSQLQCHSFWMLYGHLTYHQRLSWHWHYCY